MLVYSKIPMGYTVVGGKRVYGKNFCYGKFGPTEVSYRVYRSNKNLLEEAPYTAEILKEQFGGKFPNVIFKLSEIRFVSYGDLVSIVKAFGVEYITKRKPTTQDIRALRRSIISKLVSEK